MILLAQNNCRPNPQTSEYGSVFISHSSLTVVLFFVCVQFLEANAATAVFLHLRNIQPEAAHRQSLQSISFMRVMTHVKSVGHFLIVDVFHVTELADSLQTVPSRSLSLSFSLRHFLSLSPVLSRVFCFHHAITSVNLVIFIELMQQFFHRSNMLPLTKLLTVRQEILFAAMFYRAVMST